MQNSKLYVGNLRYSVTNEQLKELFSNYGEVRQVSIIEGKGFGFVEMSNPSEAERAKRRLDGFDFKGRILRVDEARPSFEKDRNRSSLEERSSAALTQTGRKVEIGGTMKDFIKYIAQAIVDYPEEVEVFEIEGSTTLVIEMKVAKGDIGKVIGKQGHTAMAMRTLLSAASKKRAILEIIE